MPAVCASLATPPDGVCVPLSGVRLRPPHVRLLRLHKPAHSPLAGCSPAARQFDASSGRAQTWGHMVCTTCGKVESCKCFARPSRHFG